MHRYFAREKIEVEIILVRLSNNELCKIVQHIGICVILYDLFCFILCHAVHSRQYKHLHLSKLTGQLAITVAEIIMLAVTANNVDRRWSWVITWITDR